MKYLAFLFLASFFLVEQGYGRSIQFSTISFGTNFSNPGMSCGGFEEPYEEEEGEEEEEEEEEEDEDYYEYDSQYDSEVGKLPDENAINKTLYGSHTNNSSNNYGGYQTYNSSYGPMNSTGPRIIVLSLSRNNSNPSGSSGPSVGGGGFHWQALAHNVSEILKQLFGTGSSNNFSYRRAE